MRIFVCVILFVIVHVAYGNCITDSFYVNNDSIKSKISDENRPLKTSNIIGFVPSKSTTINGWGIGWMPTSNTNINGLYTDISPISAFIGIQLVPYIFLNLGNNPSYSFLNDLENGEKYKINGLSIMPISLLESYQHNGIVISAITCVAKINGISIGGISSSVHTVNGFSVAGIINETYKTNGMQIGAINISEQVTGIQIGIFNKAKKLKGLQLGIWNKNGKIGLPLINIGW